MSIHRALYHNSYSLIAAAIILAMTIIFKTNGQDSHSNKLPVMESTQFVNEPVTQEAMTGLTTDSTESPLRQNLPTITIESVLKTTVSVNKVKDTIPKRKSDSLKAIDVIVEEQILVLDSVSYRDTIAVKQEKPAHQIDQSFVIRNPYTIEGKLQDGSKIFPYHIRSKGSTIEFKVDVKMRKGAYKLLTTNPEGCIVHQESCNGWAVFGGNHHNILVKAIPGKWTIDLDVKDGSRGKYRIKLTEKK